jgi:hypothetical protein
MDVNWIRAKKKKGGNFFDCFGRVGEEGENEMSWMNE